MYHEGSNMNILDTNMCCYCTDVLKKGTKCIFRVIAFVPLFLRVLNKSGCILCFNYDLDIYVFHWPTLMCKSKVYFLIRCRKPDGCGVLIGADSIRFQQACG